MTDPHETDLLEPMNGAIARALVDNHRRFLGFLERRVGDRETAEDILQNAFVRGLDRADALRDPEAATAWFYRLLRNAVTDHFRRRQVASRALDQVAAREADAAEPAPDPELFNEVCRCVEALLPTLRPAYAQMLERVDMGGESVVSVAATLGITPNNAAVRLHRARLALRERLERSCGTCAEHGCLDCRCQRGPEGGTGCHESH